MTKDFTDLPPIDPEHIGETSLIKMPKILIHVPSGKRQAVRGGLSWSWIAENLCNSAITGKNLYMNATGRSKRAGEWRIEVLKPSVPLYPNPTHVQKERFNDAVDLLLERIGRSRGNVNSVGDDDSDSPEYNSVVSIIIELLRALRY